MTIAERLKAARAALGLSQPDAASKSGVPVGTLRKYEQGPSLPGAEAIAGFVRLGINANWLLTGEGPMLAKEPANAAVVAMSDATKYMAMSPGPEQASAEVDIGLIDACAEACQAVHGEPFSAAPMRLQLLYATDLYNLVVRIAGLAGKSPKDALRLEPSGLAEQLRLFLKMGWAKKFPPPPPSVMF